MITTTECPLAVASVTIRRPLRPLASTTIVPGSSRSRGVADGTIDIVCLSKSNMIRCERSESNSENSVRADILARKQGCVPHPHLLASQLKARNHGRLHGRFPGDAVQLAFSPVSSLRCEASSREIAVRSAPVSTRNR